MKVKFDFVNLQNILQYVSLYTLSAIKKWRHFVFDYNSGVS